ncbi:MAG: DNA polymerase I [Rhodospirillales bacterium]
MVDGSGFIFRAYHKLPPMTRPDGTPVNAVFGFTTMLIKLLKETDADHIAVVFDAARHTFRDTLYPAYKANRPEPPDALVPQFPLIRDAVRAFNVACVESEGFEADDLIATYTRLARQAGALVTIVSSDKDLMQLVGEGVGMWDPVNNRPLGTAEVEEKFGVGPERVIDVQALAGDPTDNVPGVPGIGVKTAAQLIRQFGDLEALLAGAASIPQPKRREALITHADNARLSKRLVTLADDVEVPEPLSALAKREPDRAALRAFLQAQAFRSLITRLDLGDGAPATPTTAVQTQLAFEITPPATAAVAEVTYRLITDDAELARLIARALKTGSVAISTETATLGARGSALVGLSFAIEAAEAFYVPLAHTDADGVRLSPQLEREPTLQRLKPLLEDASVLKIGHDIKHHAHVLAGYGIAVQPFDDTMLLSYVLAGGLHGHGLNELASLHLGRSPIAQTEVVGTGRTRLGFDQVALDRALAYGAENIDATLAVYATLKPRLLAERLVTVYETLERPLAPVLATMERAGILVDRAALHRLSEDFAVRLRMLEGEIHDLAGHPFNIGSPKQLGEVLFDEMSLGVGKKGKTGAYATGADILEQLAVEGHALPGKVLDWRQLAKLKSTYADALLDQIDGSTGRVHTLYQQAVASTGRLSSTDPNLQNIPVRSEEGRKIRGAFVAPPGQVLLSADYSQIELRLVAHVADITALKDAFRDGQDIHAMTASQVFGVPVAGMDPFVRRKAKAINFGIIYGISAFGLARQLGIGRAEAGAYINAYFDRYPGIRDYMERTKREARARGYVTTPFGRRCHTKGIADKNPAARAFAERAAINAPIQGGAADIIKRAMIRLPGALADAGLAAKMLLQVHDELIFEVPAAEVEPTRELVVRTMQSVAELSVPLVVDTGTGRDWGAAH